MARPLNGRFSGGLSRAVDSAVLWRLGLISVTPFDAALTSVTDPDAFWADSRVDSPAPLVARYVRSAPPWARVLPRAARPAFVDLTGPSSGPGDHWGASHLRARVAVSPRPGAPLVLLLHGYAVPVTWYEDRQMQLLSRRGLSVARLDLPFHLGRRIHRHPPGSGFFSSDPARTLAVVRQAVEDSAAVAAWARQELGARVGVHGVSLGGLVGGLLAATTELDAAALITPACDLIAIIMELAPLRLRRQLDLLDGRGGPWGADAAAARAFLAERLAPMTLQLLAPRTAPERIVFVAAAHDRIVGLGPVCATAAAWGADCWQYPLGHVMVLTARGLGSRLHARLAADLAFEPAAQPAAAG